MKKYLIIILLAVLWGCNNSEKFKETKTFAQTSREVTVVKSVKKEINYFINYSGRLEADKIMNVSPAFSAKIEKLLVSKGDFVQEDQLLAKLENSQLDQLETRFTNMKKNYKRMKNLYNSKSIDQKTFDEVETGYLVMKESLETMRDNTDLTTPINGMVSNIMVEEGGLFNAMTNPFLIRVVNLRKMKVVINISDADLSRIRVGNKAQLSINQKKYTGNVTYISPEADVMSGTILCEISVNNSNNELKHNQFAKVKIITKSSQNAIVVPSKSIVNNVLFVSRNGKAESINVKIGIRNENEAEIISGVEVGEDIITVGIVGLNSGDPVNNK
ncbi:MAG: efflux RND transporter periplasmic adaptor subunit [Candidatus Cloacimonadota bacterium]|nr:efflux RND transporter periplasmic adaptor subunit [Candidatus Cloacimonadota bacterium]